MNNRTIIMIAMMAVVMMMGTASATQPTVDTAKVTGANELTVVFNTTVNAVVGDFTDLKGDIGARNVTGISGNTTDTIVVTFDGAAVGTNATATIDLGTGINSVDDSTALVAVDDQVVADGQAPTFSVTSVSPTSGNTAKVDDDVVVTVTAGDLETGLTASGTPTVNGVNAVFAEVGAGIYTITYAVVEGNNDISDAAALPVSIILQDAAENAGTEIATIAAGDAPGIDANTPTLSSAARVDDTHINVTMSEAVTSLGTGAGGFTVAENGAEPAVEHIVSAIAVGGSAEFVVLTVEDMAESGAAGVNVTYNAADANGTINDTAGNALATNTIGVTVAAWDIVAPVVNTVTLNTTAPNTGDAILVTVNATDEGEVTNVTVGSVELTSQGDHIWNGTITAEVGYHSVNVSAKDAAGNVGWNNSTSYTTTTPDTTAPVVNTVTLNTTAPNTGDAILVTVNATDEGEVTNVTVGSVELTFQDGNIWNGTITATEGTHSVNVSAKDAEGNTGWNNSTSYTATTPDTTAPTLESYTITNTTITPPQTTSIDVRFSEQVSAIIKIEDASGNLVNELYSSSGVTNPDPQIWNGTNTTDTQVPDGEYTVNVSGVNLTTGRSVINTSRKITVTSEAQTLDSIVISPESCDLIVGGSRTFTAVCYNGSTVIDCPTLTWNSSNTTVGAITSEGAFTAAVAGMTTINASAEGITSNAATVTVSPEIVRINSWDLPATGSRGIAIDATVNITNTGTETLWFVVSISGTQTETGDPLVGLGTIRLDGNEFVDVPVRIAIPGSADTGSYTLTPVVYKLADYPAGDRQAIVSGKSVTIS